MTVIFKSDKSVSYPKILEVAQGLSFDFRQNEYSVDGNTTTLDAAMQNTTITKRGYIGIGRSYREAAIGENKIAVNITNRKLGLHKEGITPVNLMADVALQLPATHTKVYDSTGIDTYVLSMQGDGSARVELNSVLLADILTETNELVLSATDINSTRIKITKQGSVDYIALHANPKYTAIPLNRNISDAVTTADVIQVNPLLLNKTFPTLVFDFSLPPSKSYASNRDAKVLKVTLSTGAYLEVGYSTGSGKFLVKFVVSGVGTSLASALAETKGGLVAIKFDGNTARAYYNGEYLGETTVGSGAAISKIEVGILGYNNTTTVNASAFIHQIYADMTVKTHEQLIALTAI